MNTESVSQVGATRPAAGRSGAADAEPALIFESLLVPLLPRAYSAARHLTGDASDAEDLVQEAALLAWKGFGTFRPGTNFKAWFLRILTNAFYMKCRSERRMGGTLSLDETPDLYLYNRTREAGLHEGEGNPAQRFMSRLTTEQVTAAISGLPPEFRVVATLYFVDDLSYQEIATILDCPVGTVRSRLHRARKILQVALWKVAKDHGIV